MGKLQINILGTSFKVQAKEDDAYLDKLLSYYKEITRAVADSGNIVNSLQVSILSGITLVDELYREKQKNALLLKKLHEGENQQTEELTEDMIEKLSAALSDLDEEDDAFSIQNTQLSEKKESDGKMNFAQAAGKIMEDSDNSHNQHNSEEIDLDIDMDFEQKDS